MRSLILPNGNIIKFPDDRVRYDFGFKSFVDNIYYILRNFSNYLRENDIIASEYLIKASSIYDFHTTKYNYFINKLPDNSINFISSLYIPDNFKITEKDNIIFKNGESGSLLDKMRRLSFFIPFIDIEIDIDKVDNNLITDIENWNNLFMLAFIFTVPTLIMYAVNHIARKSALNLRGYECDWPDNGASWPVYAFSITGFKPKRYCSICGFPSIENESFICDGCGAHNKMFKKWPDIDKTWPD